MSNKRENDQAYRDANTGLLYQCVQTCCDFNALDLSPKEKDCLKKCQGRTLNVHKLYQASTKGLSSAFK